ncbi:hypothetical protein I79_006634 [Cricetulus griseus]|uniref:Uncharacterized protein n=1 Tax=Cricetulus griseus TaxID=10029 RepID=G3H8D4_CRIGR|nr:hypothetical protein I79_006634 [Cricetulus griseus]
MTALGLLPARCSGMVLALPVWRETDCVQKTGQDLFRLNPMRQRTAGHSGTEDSTT